MRVVYMGGALIAEWADAFNGGKMKPSNNSNLVIEFQRMIGKYSMMITDQREEILQAFIAKYGCQPDEIEQVIQHEDNKTIWYVRKRVTINLRTNYGG